MIAAALALASTLSGSAVGQSPPGQLPDTVVVRSGALELRALLWRPAGRGPFPAVLFNHGSGPARASTTPERTAIGSVFARHGYVFLFLYGRGAGLSASAGTNSFDEINKALAEKGQAGRNAVQLQRLEHDDLNDAVAGLAFLRALPEVDARRITVAGHSFGGSLSLLLAERDTTVRAALVFGGAAGSWDSSATLRARLISAVGRARAAVFLIYAANDYSVAPGNSLAAEMKRRGKPHRLEIYPPLGRTADEGHDFVYRAVPTWERDVFAFLTERMRR